MRRRIKPVWRARYDPAASLGEFTTVFAKNVEIVRDMIKAKNIELLVHTENEANITLDMLCTAKGIIDEYDGDKDGGALFAAPPSDVRALVSWALCGFRGCIDDEASENSEGDSDSESAASD